MAQQKFIDVDHLKIRFPIRTGSGRSFITPVDDVSFQIDQGEVCEETPELRNVGNEHFVACHYAEELA